MKLPDKFVISETGFLLFMIAVLIIEEEII